MFGDAGAIGLIQDLSRTRAQDFDGGIHPGANLAFQRYENRVMASTEALIANLLTGKDQFSDAHEGAADDYQRYLLIRNYIEFADAGKSGAYFPSDDSFLQFACLYSYGGYPRRDDQILDILNTLIDNYGRKALREAARQLRVSELNFKLWPTNAEAMGIPMSSRMPLDALLTLTHREADAKAYAVGTLRTPGYGSDAYADGQAVYDAMVNAHGETKVLAVAKAVQAMALSKMECRIASGQHVGLSPRSVMFLELPIDGDPGWERRRTRIAAYEAEQKRLVAEARAEAERKAIAQGRRFSELHYERFQDAYALAKQLDKSGNKSGHVDRVLAVAGLWNYAIESIDFNHAGARSSAAMRDLVSNVPKKQTEDMAKLVGFVAAYDRFDFEYLVPMKQIQQERIEAGALDPADALDLSMTPEKRKILNGIAQFEKNVQDIRAKRKSNPRYEMKRDDYVLLANDNRWRRWLKDYEQRDALPIGWTEADMLGKRQLMDLIAVRDQAIIGDHFELDKINDYRGYSDLKPLDRLPTAELYADVAASRWNSYLLTGEEQALIDARQARIFLGNIDVPGRLFYNRALDFVHDGFKESQWVVKPTPPSAIQRRLIDSGQLDPERALNFATDHETYLKLVEITEKQDAFHRRVLRVSFGNSPEGQAKKQQAIAEAQQAINALKSEVDAIDKANGYPTRFPTHRSPLIDSLISKPEPMPTEQQDVKPGPKSEPETTVLEGRALGEAQLEAFYKALEAAQARDADALKAINAERAELDLPPIAGYTPATDLVQLMAGFWDAEITGRIKLGSSSARKNLIRLRSVDRALHEKIAADLEVVFQRRPRNTEPPLALSQVKKPSDDRLHLRATKTLDGLVDDMHDAVEDRLAAERKAEIAKRAGDKQSTIDRAEQRAAKAREDEAKAREALASFAD